MSQRIRIIISLIIQLLVLSSIVLYGTYYLKNGQIVILNVSSSNSNDKVVNGGEYLILDYDIDSITLDDNIKTDFDYQNANLQVKDLLYVTLEENKELGYWTPIAVTKEVPKISLGKVFVMANYLYLNNNDIRLTYSFKNYFIPLNKNISIDTTKESNMKLKLLVKPDGEVKLLNLLIDDIKV